MKAVARIWRKSIPGGATAKPRGESALRVFKVSEESGVAGAE